jgi:hypothetical protein
MPATRRHRRKPPSQRSALRLLAAAGPVGCPAGTLAASGFGVADLIMLVHAGLATPAAELLVDQQRTFDLSHKKNIWA